MLHPRKEISVSSDVGVESSSKHVEFEVENVTSLQSPVQMPASTEVEKTPHVEEEEEYFIIKYKPPTKKIRPTRFEVDISFALAMAEETNAVDEPSTYLEAVSYVDSGKRLVAMQK